jgi:hypothetical protein
MRKEHDGREGLDRFCGIHSVGLSPHSRLHRLIVAFPHNRANSRKPIRSIDGNVIGPIDINSGYPEGVVPTAMPRQAAGVRVHHVNRG